MKPNGLRTASFGLAGWIARHSFTIALGVLAIVAVNDPHLAGIGATLLLLGMTAGGHVEKRIQAGTRHSDVKGTNAFILCLDKEVVTLEPGKNWTQLDHFKWVVRGIIEPPQSLNIFQDGSIEINTEKISIADPEGPARLEHQINKHHATTVVHKPVTATPAQAVRTQTSSGKPQFLVKLDHWGHMVIEWGHGLDREETGLRGLSTLIANGLIRKPNTFHVDPLQRGIEIDGIRYDCTEEGAKRLEVALNARYAVTRRIDKAVAVEIKENHAASTGFDMHFTIHQAGVPLEIRGHLTQEKLDILQDQAKCDLLHPGIHLLLTPPYLLFRRRRPDMGEEKIPEVPDVNILHCTAAQLQEALNHPVIRKGRGGSAAAAAAQQAGADSNAIVELRVARHATDKALLWIECVAATGEIQGPKAFTHHNVSDLQQSGLFQPHLEVHLSLDHRKLSIQNRQTKHEEVITLDTSSPDDDLRKAGRMLTKALKPAAPRAVASREPVEAVPAPVAESPAPVEEPPVAEPPTPAAAVERPSMATPSQRPAAPPPPEEAKPKLDPAIVALFHETDAVRINVESFRRLVEWLAISPQDVRLSLPFVFENRQFEIVSFENQEITDLAQLRGVEFYGFYLSHISEKKIVLVYACNGIHIEWGPDKCVLQPTATAEATEYKGSALLGLAQDQQDGFVFIVQPAFKQWIEPREKPYVEESVHFLTVADIAKSPDDYKFIWPEWSASVA